MLLSMCNRHQAIQNFWKGIRGLTEYEQCLGGLHPKLTSVILIVHALLEHASWMTASKFLDNFLWSNYILMTALQDTDKYPDGRTEVASNIGCYFDLLAS